MASTCYCKKIKYCYPLKCTFKLLIVFWFKKKGIFMKKFQQRSLGNLSINHIINELIFVIDIKVRKSTAILFKSHYLLRWNCPTIQYLFSKSNHPTRIKKFIVLINYCIISIKLVQTTHTKNLQNNPYILPFKYCAYIKKNSQTVKQKKQNKTTITNIREWLFP